jgi:hypothetical protein
MKKFVWAETRVEGGKPFTGKLAQPPSATGPFQNIGGSGNAQGAETPSRYGTWYADAAVVAFRVPGAARSMADLQPTLSSSSGRFTLASLTEHYATSPRSRPGGEKARFNSNRRAANGLRHVSVCGTAAAARRWKPQ